MDAATVVTLALALASLLDWFVKFPALWAAAGFVVSGAITATVATLIFRKYGDDLVKINDKIVVQQDKQLAMMERTLRMQKEHYEAEAAETKTRYEAAIEEVKTDWQKCRQILHDERKEWNSESMKMKLLIQDLEGRPNLSTLNTTLEQIVSLVQKVGENLDNHDKSIDLRMQKFIEAIKPKRTAA